MSSILSKNPLVEKIIFGDTNEELLQFLLSKQLAFTEEEYLESAVFVMQNEAHRERARQLLSQISDSVKKSYAQKKEANERVAHFLLLEALERQNLAILTTVIQNAALPYEFLVAVGERGPAAALDVLIENQIRLIAYPEILDAMERNPQVTPFLLGRIREVRDFYLREQKAEEIPAAAVLPSLTEVIAEEKKAERQQKQETEEQGEKKGEELPPLEIEVEKIALTTLQKINRMSITERIKLALSGSKTERMVLIKDSNKMVQLAVLESPKINEDEILIYSKDKALAGDLVSKIANSRDWTRNYTIILSLIQNPKTPINRALGFIKQLHERDLKLVMLDKNINPVIRNLAASYFRNKDKVRG